MSRRHPLRRCDLHRRLHRLRAHRVLRQALEQVEAWLESPTVMLLAESRGYWPHLRVEVERSRSVGSRVHDARIAALCRFHRTRELWTADRDFSRFPGLPVRNPLVA